MNRLENVPDNTITGKDLDMFDTNLNTILEIINNPGGEIDE